MTLTSVITIVKDHELGLRRTVSSLLMQSHTDWELIIVVGPSIDETITTARDYELTDARIRVVEQSGRGIYPAMNEGIQNSLGETIWFMNAGDCFATPEVISKTLEIMSARAVGLLIGGYEIQGNSNRSYTPERIKRIGPIGFAFNRRGGCHQSMLFNAATVRAVGSYDIKFKLASDFDLILKVIRESGGLRIPVLVTTIEPGGIADSNLGLVFHEKHQIRIKTFKYNLAINLASRVWTVLANFKLKTRRPAN